MSSSSSKQPYRSQRKSHVGILGREGITGPTGSQGLQPPPIEGPQGECGLPGPTCLCYLDTDLLDVQITGPTGGDYLTYNNGQSVWRNVVELTLDQIDFSDIPEYSFYSDALKNLDNNKLYKLVNSSNIKLTPVFAVTPIAYWGFCEGTGASVSDEYSDPNDNEATINATMPTVVDWTTDSKFGTYAMEFKSGTFEPLSGTNTAGFPSLSNLNGSYSVWYKATSVPDGIAGVFMMHSIIGHAGRFFGLVGPGVLGTGNYGIATGSFATSSSDLSVIISDAIDGNWHHVVATIDEDVNIKIYFDGSEVASAQKINFIRSETGFSIGSSQLSSDSRPFAGTMDDLAIFDTILTLEQVEYLYNNGTGRPAFGVK